MPAEVFVSRRARFGVLRLFDGAVVSGEERIVKPSREIFERLTSRYSIEAAESLFVDDSDINAGPLRPSGSVFTASSTLPRWRPCSSTSA
jgi:FMN phosphatase YigB (HAD superfamily)